MNAVGAFAQSEVLTSGAKAPAIAPTVVQNDRAFLESIDGGAPQAEQKPQAEKTPAANAPEKAQAAEKPAIQTERANTADVPPVPVPRERVVVKREPQPPRVDTAPEPIAAKPAKVRREKQEPAPTVARAEDNSRKRVANSLTARRPANVARAREEQAPAGPEARRSRALVQLEPFSPKPQRSIEVRRALPVEEDREEEDEDEEDRREEARDARHHGGLLHRIFNDRD